MNSDVSGDQNALLPPMQNRSYKYQLEFALMLLLFSYNLSTNILPNQLLKACCLFDGFDFTNCSQLNSNNVSSAIEDVIQPQVAHITMVTNVMHSVIPAIVSLLLGPWTDKFGRRKALIIIFVGFSMSLIGFSIVSTVADLRPVISPWIYVLPHFPAVLTGGYGTLLLLSLCYVTDTSDDFNRSTRLTIIEIIMFGGFISGKLISSFMIDRTGASVIFHIASLSAIIATIFIIFFLYESNDKVEDTSGLSQLRELISPKPIVEMIKTCFKQRENNDRKVLWCAMFVVVCSVCTYHGSFSVFYLFLREKFRWTLKDASLFQTFTSVLTTAGCIIGITIFKRILKITDVLLLSFSITSRLAEYSIQAFAEDPITMYISVFIGTFSNLTGPMCRSVIASLIPHNEIGKVYSFISALESSSTLIASPLYTMIYDATFKTFTGAFMLLTSSVYMVVLVISVFICRMMKQRERTLNSNYIENEN